MSTISYAHTTLKNCLADTLNKLCRLEHQLCSKVFVVRGSLLILNVVFIVKLDSAVRQFRIVNLVATMTQSARASPMPMHSADELEACDLLISQVSDNLQHFSTVAVESEHLEVHQARSVNSVLQNQGAGGQARKEPLRILSVLPQMSLHLI